MLIGNPVDFDRIRARYEALRYPTPEEASFNATRASYEGLLTGSGFDTQMVPTTTPGEQVSFSVDPNTGQVTTQIPQYDIPNFQTIYDVGEGLIGSDGLPISTGNIGASSTPFAQQVRRREPSGEGRERLAAFKGERPGISNEVFGDTALRINEDGTVSVIDRDTLDYNFTKAMDTITDFGILGALKGDESYEDALNRIEKDYGKATADEVALNVKEQYAANQYSEPKGPSGKGPSRQASKADRDRASKGMTGGGFCFDPDTLVKMHDGTEKKIKDIKLGDQTKGGEVTGVFQFKASDEIHDYKGVTVAGSHYVKEDGKFIMVQDSPISVKIDKIPVVHSLDTTGRRIFIKDIEFADYNGDGIAKGFLANAGVDLTGFDKEVLRQVENRLI
jgi:hypothetical protein